jgi:hypothetical protein
MNMNLYESIKGNLNDQSYGEVYTICYNAVDIWKSKKAAMDFYEEAIYACEGAERERYINVYRDLKDGETFAYDGNGNNVREIHIRDDNGDIVERVKVDGPKNAAEAIFDYKNGDKLKESGERFQIRKYDKTGAPYGIYDMKSKKFVKRGEKKNLEKELKERNEKDKMKKESQSLKEGTFGEEVGFDEYASIDEMEYNFAHDLLEYLGTSVDYASWVDFNKFELHRGTSWVDDNAWMRVDLEIPDNTVYEIINQHKDQYPTASELGDDLSIYSTGIEIGGAGKGFYNVRTYTTFEPHYSWYYDENGENKDRAVTKAVEDKLSAEEDVLCEYIDKIVTEHYKDLLQIMLDNEYYDEEYEEEKDE